ncbi:MAG: FKBP-type peptidyl-prolyl cis-trans isomerase [Gemmatimonadota bacterium]|nr:FKBP-type peptidyl-prolyl cis-trans isomerase [Gemmatimonadota bacterium]
MHTSVHGPLRGSLCAPLVLGALVLGCERGEPEPDPPEMFAPELGVDISDMDRTDSGLYVQVLEEGSGDPAVNGQRISVVYTGWLVNGTPIDSAAANDPRRVTIGEDYMVDGFMEGVEGIRIGERRLLLVKPDLGYARELVPDVPRGSWLVYQVRRVPSG